MASLDLSATRNPEASSNDLAIIFGVTSTGIAILGLVIRLWVLKRAKKNQGSAHTNDIELQRLVQQSGSPRNSSQVNSRQPVDQHGPVNRLGWVNSHDSLNPSEQVNHNDQASSLYSLTEPAGQTVDCRASA